MPSDRPIKSVVMTEDLEEIVKRDAIANDRTFSAQVAHILKKYYAEQLRTAEAVNPRLREVLEPERIPTYGVRPEDSQEASEEARHWLGKDKKL